MPFNGNGNFSLVYDWIQDRNNGIKILASRMMGQEQDIADGLSDCITADGQTTVTNTIPMSGNQITLLASATTRTGAMNLGQYQDGSAAYSSASGINSYVGVLDPAITAYPNGMTARVYFPNTNTSSSTAQLDLGGGYQNLVVGNGQLAGVGVITPGVGIVVSRAGSWQYFPSSGVSQGAFQALAGKLAGVASTGTVEMVDQSRYQITGGTVKLPTMSVGSFSIVEMIPAPGVTVTVGRNAQTIDGTAADDTFLGDGSPGPVVRYEYLSAGVVTSRLVEGVPV